MRPVYRILLLVAAVAGALLLWQTRSNSPASVVDALLPNFATNRTPSQTFAVIGDNEGSNPVYDDLIRQIAADSAIQFVLHVGDATSTGAAAELQALKTLHEKLGLRVPVYMVPGNHDIIDDQATQAWSKNVGERWRSLDVGNVHLVLLDNADRKVGFPTDELDWLEKDLADSPSRRLADSVTILAFHRPFNYPLANILGDDETRTSRASNERFMQILAANPVDYIFTGHVHTAIDYTMVLERDANDRIAKSVPVTVSGGGGQPIQAAFGGLLKEKFHALKVEVVGKEVRTSFILPRVDPSLVLPSERGG
ncbi:MAG: metallophosphoesterase [Patescibacteria group bacterium]